MILEILNISAIFLLAGLGELIDERSGVLNLGVEGMMVTGALFGIMVTEVTGNPWIGIIGGMLAGGALSLLHGILSISLNVSQVVSGTGIWLLGEGITAYLGASFTGVHTRTIEPVLWELTPLFFLAVALVPLIWFILFKTYFGLTIRTVGENPSVADVMGININRIRFICVIVGGLLAGLAGAYLSLVYTPVWSRNVTAGRGWIALALVYLSMWRPFVMLFGSFLFGFLWIFSIKLQLMVNLPSSLLRTIPYISAIIILTIISSKRFRAKISEPAALGKPYIREK